MKKALLALGALALTGSAFAQGTLTFFNNNLTGATGTYRAGIFRDNGDATIGNSTIGAGAGFKAVLIAGSDPNGTVLGTVTFRTTTAQEVFSASGGDIPITGAAPGSTATVTVAAFDGTSYATAATQRGFQTFTTRALGGPNPDPTAPAFTPPDMGPGFTGFEMQLIPEPSTIALGAIGIGALLLRRRK